MKKLILLFLSIAVILSLTCTHISAVECFDDNAFLTDAETGTEEGTEGDTEGGSGEGTEGDTEGGAGEGSEGDTEGDTEEPNEENNGETDEPTEESDGDEEKKSSFSENIVNRDPANMFEAIVILIFGIIEMFMKLFGMSVQNICHKILTLYIRY